MDDTGQEPVLPKNDFIKKGKTMVKCGWIFAILVVLSIIFISMGVMAFIDLDDIDTPKPDIPVVSLKQWKAKQEAYKNHKRAKAAILLFAGFLCFVPMYLTFRDIVKCYKENQKHSN